ncbi:hypothetical protein [uncultured Amnibacterium sp.]|uniref:hypothetical protein n=1 Tax=uncultured Amnibacterium sp. TaxID=1631851 RepID=UPI0035C9EA4E
MTADQFLLALSKYWRGGMALVLVGLLGALGFAATRPVLYESRSTVYVSADEAGSRGGVIQSSHYVDTAVQSLAKIGATPAVLNPVITALGLRATAAQLAQRVSVDVGTNTVVLTVRALAGTPADSVRLANAVRTSLSRQQAVLSTRVIDGSGLVVPALTVHLITAPRLPSAPASPNLHLILATGALIGLLLGLLYAIARQLVGTRVTSVAELRGVACADSVPFLGAVPPTDPTADIDARDAYRTVALHLGVPGAGPRTLVVAGTGHDDSVTAAARGIAQAGAERSERVLLVDADLRRPVAEQPGLGLAEVLQGTSSLQDAVQQGSAFTVLAAGTPPADPGALLGSDAARRLIAQLAERFDLVVIQAPAVLAGPDAVALALAADGAVLVAHGGATRAADVTRSVESAHLAGVTLTGIVFERPRPRRALRRTRPSTVRSGSAAAAPTASDDHPAPAFAAAAPADTAPVTTP